MLTLLFFAGSSLLARAALAPGEIDAFSFTFLRLFSGALTLALLMRLRRPRPRFSWKSHWHGALMLFLYAICFSYAYLKLDAGLGALVLFAVVQLTLMVVACLRREPPTLRGVFGILTALAGLAYLLYPSGPSAPSLPHIALMAAAGAAWGLYTVLGKNSADAALQTAENFAKSLPFLLLFAAVAAPAIHFSTYGVLLAAASGGLTSALGYVMWYRLLPAMNMLTAGIVQLLIPPLAILLGVLLLNETLSGKLLTATALILAGIALYLQSKPVAGSGRSR